jgi:hypothetical protein
MTIMVFISGTHLARQLKPEVEGLLLADRLAIQRDQVIYEVAWTLTPSLGVDIHHLAIVVHSIKVQRFSFAKDDYELLAYIM